MAPQGPKCRECLLLSLIIAVAANAGGGVCWIQFSDETDTRLIADAAVGSTDLEEKDYAWGDVDNDGDTDLVVARKQPFTTAGRRINILFVNEGVGDGHKIDGVLVDRTAQYVVDADIEGDQGFLTPTNDRDIVLVDVNNDGWLDMVTAVSINDDQPKHIGHPRVYINKGESDGAWQGFRFEDARIPQLFTVGGMAVNPRFFSVTPVDVDQDGDLDLYFTDMDSSGGGGLFEPPGFDLNDRLLINDGTGYFEDESFRRMTPQMLLSGASLASGAADFNGDGAVDILKQTALQPPQYVSISYNDPENPGYFDRHWIYTAGIAPYFVATGELNNDGRPDIVIGDDFSDSYLINTGNETSGTSEGLAHFVRHTFSLESGFDDGFVGGVLIIDLNKDGLNDVLISDVEPDIPGCTRRLHIYKNMGDFTADDVTIIELAEFVSPSVGWKGAPGLQISDLRGTYDTAVFDINGDDINDLILGQCTGTSVYLGAPYSEGDASTCTCGHKGDCDGDCNIDLVDFANFQTCYTGPGSAWAEGCWCSDFDDDGDVDLADFAQFQIAFTGP